MPSCPFNIFCYVFSDYTCLNVNLHSNVWIYVSCILHSPFPNLFECFFFFPPKPEELIWWKLACLTYLMISFPCRKHVWNMFADERITIFYLQFSAPLFLGLVCKDICRYFWFRNISSTTLHFLSQARAINCYVCSFVEGTSKIFDSLAIKSVRERFFRFQDILVASSYLGLVSMGNVRHQLYQVLFRARVDDDWRDSKPTYSRPSPFVLDYSH